MLPKVPAILTAIACVPTLFGFHDLAWAQSDSVFVPQAQPVPSQPRAAPKSVAPRATKQEPKAAPGLATKGPMPQGASSISETYGDWTLNCRVDNEAKVCTLSQTQVNKETGQRAFAVELRTLKGGAGEGTILMPFGLKLDSGANLKLDDKDLEPRLRFSTCLAQGCLLPVSFPSNGMAALRSATTFKVDAVNASNSQAISFSVSLNGFALALDRALQLSS
jgi:invasion protein IalB